MIGRLAGGFGAVMVGISLIGPVSKQVNLAQQSSNLTATPLASSLLEIVPIFFALAILVVGIGIAYTGLRDAGLFGFSDEYQGDYELEQEKREPEQKQTYEEYVRERLRIEKMMRWGWIGRWL